MRLLYAAVLGTVTILPSTVFAQSPLTTTFADNNSGGNGTGVFFDVTVGASGLSVNALDINATAVAGAAVGVDVFIRAGTHVGFEQSSMGW